MLTAFALTAGLVFLQPAASTAQSAVVPILELKVGGLLGGVQNGKFVDAKSTFATLKGGVSYDIFGIKRQNSKLTATVEKPDEPCDDFYYLKDGKSDDFGVAIGSGIVWKPDVRTSTAISLTDKTYLNIVSGILRLKGLPNAKAVIEQAVRVDLDGDGVDEVLLTASSYGGSIQPSAKANDYSFVLLRKLVAGKAQNIMIAEEYVKRNVKFGAPSRFDISAIADLNGDGKMEIVVFSEYYEGSGSVVYEIKGSKAIAVKELESACGV